MKAVVKPARLSGVNYLNRFQRSQRAWEIARASEMGPLAQDILGKKKIFLPNSVKQNIASELNGARLSEKALKNVSIRHLSKLIDSVADKNKFGTLDWNASIDDAEEYCEHIAEKIEGILVHHRNGNAPSWYFQQCAQVRANPKTFWGFNQSHECQQDINQILSNHNLEPLNPDLSESKYLPTLLRICDPKWWVKKYKRQFIRLIDEVSRTIGRVSRDYSPYVSNKALNLWEVQQRKNQKMLESVQLENDEGQVFDLKDLVAKSTANKEIRRAELMTRLRGFDILAELKGYKSEFWTLTCPSRFHPTTQITLPNGKTKTIENAKWVEAGRPTVREAQAYLQGVWSRIRADIARANINWFGFRIAEPHADGCPHWHLIMYAASEHVSQKSLTIDKTINIQFGSIAEFAKNQALADSPEESGASKHRFTVEPIKDGINPDTGNPYSATGYVAKYISKNIDGFGMDEEKDFDGGGDITSNAKRVTAWASVHAIRQFQQFGGAPVGLWREVRRLYALYQREQESLNESGELEDNQLKPLFEITEQEDSAAAFCLLYEDSPQTLNIEYSVREIHLKPVRTTGGTGEPANSPIVRTVIGRYGELVESIWGLSIKGKKFCTRPTNWTLTVKGLPPPCDIDPPDWEWLLGRASPG